MTLKIGELAKKAGVTHRTIRYYEELSLLTPNFRGQNKYRYYDESHLYKLQSIKLLQKLGYGLKDIAAAVAPIMGQDGKCPPAGKEIAKNLLVSLKAKRSEYLEKIEEYQSFIKGIDEFMPELTVCLDCAKEPKAEDCSGCQIGNQQVIQFVKQNSDFFHQQEK